jgi:hypothetical protein
MNVQLFLVQAWARAAVPTGLETTGKFAEEAEPFTQVQIQMQKVALHQVGVSMSRTRQLLNIEIFAAVPSEYAERKVIVLVVPAKRDKLQTVQEFGSTIRIAEIPIVFVIRQLRKGRGLAGATRLRLLPCLRRSADTRDKHQ